MPTTDLPDYALEKKSALLFVTYLSITLIDGSTVKVVDTWWMLLSQEGHLKIIQHCKNEWVSFWKVIGETLLNPYTRWFQKVCMYVCMSWSMSTPLPGRVNESMLETFLPRWSGSQGRLFSFIITVVLGQCFCQGWLRPETLPPQNEKYNAKIRN